jgi:hypothetical protein
VIAVDRTDAQHRQDEISDFVYVLQGGTPVSSPMIEVGGSLRVEGAYIFETRGHLTIRHAEYSAELRVGPSTNTAGITDDRTAVGVNLWFGYGLARSETALAMDTDSIAAGAERGFVCNCGRLAADPKFGFPDFNLMSDCGNGGPGSSGCSISVPGGFSCSVSCQEGYFACCNVLGGCRCIQEPNGGGPGGPGGCERDCQPESAPFVHMG